jgi:hypothetical protein
MQRAVALQNIVLGGIFFVTGTAVTVLSYRSGADGFTGGIYLLTWVVALAGGIWCLRGLIQLRNTFG